MILLTYPKTGSDAKGASTSLPLSVLSLAANLVDDHEVIIYDQRVDPIQKYITALERSPLFVGISSMTGPQITHGIHLSWLAHEMGIPTVWGGIHPSLFPEQTVQHPYVTWVVVGDGEIAVHDMADWPLPKPQHSMVAHGPPPVLNHLPDYPYELIDIEDYVNTKTVIGKRTLPFLFSRGCPRRCAFCCNPALYRHWRSMDWDLAARRVHNMVDRFDLDSVWFYDENILARKQTASALFGEIANGFKWMIQGRADDLLNYDLRWLKQQGLELVCPGLESGSPRILSMIQKDETVDQYVEVNRRLASSGINVIYNWMIGFPSETWDEVLMTVDLALKLLDENPLAQHNGFYTYVPYPGTALADSINYQWPKRLEDWADYNRHHFKTPWIQPIKDKLSKVALSSKFVGKRIPSMFPDDDEVKQLQETFTAKWRERDFESDDWDGLLGEANETLSQLFS